MRWELVTEEVTASLNERGLDLVHPFQLAWYNSQMPEPVHCLPDLGRPTALGLLIGNTRGLWPKLCAALENAPDLRRERDPIDRYAMDAVTSAVSVLDARWLVRWAHEMDPNPLPIQRVAWATGLAMLAPSHLSVHALHGPWIALRAVVVVDIDGPATTAPACADPCTNCDKPCVDALTRALGVTRGRPDPETVERDWESWVSVRDACPIGRESRYSDDQIKYHYTKLRQLLT